MGFREKLDNPNQREETNHCTNSPLITLCLTIVRAGFNLFPTDAALFGVNIMLESNVRKSETICNSENLGNTPSHWPEKAQVDNDFTQRTSGPGL